MRFGSFLDRVVKRSKMKSFEKTCPQNVSYSDILREMTTFPPNPDDQVF